MLVSVSSLEPFDDLTYLFWTDGDYVDGCDCVLDHLFLSLQFDDKQTSVSVSSCVVFFYWKMNKMIADDNLFQTNGLRYILLLHT